MSFLLSGLYNPMIPRSKLLGNLISLQMDPSKWNREDRVSMMEVLHQSCVRNRLRKCYVLINFRAGEEAF